MPMTARDNQTKRKAVCTALAVSPSWSDRRVAEHCLVSQPLVGKVRRERAEEAAAGNGSPAPADLKYSTTR